jgi:hypothetical protein
MKMKLKNQVQQVGEAVFRLRIVLFLLLLVVLYGFVLWRIQSLSNTQPDQQAIDLQVSKTTRPRIDQALVDKIEQLESSNVTVQALFNEARKNPFRE